MYCMCITYYILCIVCVLLITYCVLHVCYIFYILCIVCYLLHTYYVLCIVYSCDRVEPDVNDLLSYAHFLNVVLNYSLCQGNIPDAIKYGTYIRT